MTLRLGRRFQCVDDTFMNSFLKKKRRNGHAKDAIVCHWVVVVCRVPPERGSQHIGPVGADSFRMIHSHHLEVEETMVKCLSGPTDTSL